MKTAEFFDAVNSITPDKELKTRITQLAGHKPGFRLEKPARLVAALGVGALLCAGVVAGCLLLQNLMAPGGNGINPILNNNGGFAASPGTETVSPNISKAIDPAPSDAPGLEPTSPKLTPGQDIGVDMVELDYASDDSVIFHGYFGLFVYDLKSQKIIRSVDLKPIGCAATQGDNFCEISVSADGNTVHLHPVSSKSMYVYTVIDNTLREMAYESMDARYTSLVDTVEAIGNPTNGFSSYSAVRFGTGEYGYIHTSDWKIGTLAYVRGDTVYELFGSYPMELQAATPTPANTDEMTARDTLDQFFQHKQEKDVPGMESLLVEGKRGIAWEIEKWEYFKINSIEDITSNELVQSYMLSGAGSASHPVEVRVFRVVFDVKFTGGNASGMSDGTYDWNYFVVKPAKDALWLIEDWGS